VQGAPHPPPAARADALASSVPQYFKPGFQQLKRKPQNRFRREYPLTQPTVGYSGNPLLDELLDWCSRNDVTARELARLLEVDQTKLNRWFAGKGRRPTDEEVTRMLHLLPVSARRSLLIHSGDLPKTLGLKKCSGVGRRPAD
jgi:hypothetical protein